MSRFYADISGGRGTARREGHSASGIRANVRGHSSGVKVYGRASNGVGTDGQDVDIFDIFITGGSNGGQSDHFIGYVGPDGFIPYGDEEPDAEDVLSAYMP
jgi:hypothetical protein